jgi:hypothetical protein
MPTARSTRNVGAGYRLRLGCIRVVTFMPGRIAVVLLALAAICRW